MTIKLFTTAIFTTAFITLPALADDTKHINDREEHIINESDNINSTESSRGSVTQGVIGAEADENKKIIPDSSPGETDGIEDHNIRLPDVTDDQESHTNEVE